MADIIKHWLIACCTTLTVLMVFPLLEKWSYGNQLAAAQLPGEPATQPVRLKETSGDPVIDTPVSISDIPLAAISKGAPANIMFVLDDSGSMLWEVMTPDEDQGLFDGYQGVFDGHRLPHSRRMEWKSQWYGYNRMYYNPSVHYVPWPRVVDISADIHAKDTTWDKRLFADADLNRPRFHPMRSDAVLEMDAPFATIGEREQGPALNKRVGGDRNQFENNSSLAVGPFSDVRPANQPRSEGGDDSALSTAGKEIEIPNAHYYQWSETDEAPYLVVFDKESASIVYYRASGSSLDNLIGNRDDIVTGLQPVSDPPDDVRVHSDYKTARQNFTNWFTYYRQRRSAAVSAVARAVVSIEGMQVGIYSIHGRIVLPVQPVKVDGEDHSDTILQELYQAEASGATPLRRALEDVGRYFDATGNDPTPLGNNAPWAESTDGGECQQSFAIVMTDGYWNSDGARTPAVQQGDNYATDSDGDGDTDADDRDSDGHYLHRSSQSDTLADVAMYYYGKDLNTTLGNNVVSNPQLTMGQKDQANWQHMVTFGVSFGVSGTLDVAEYNLHVNEPGRNFPDWPMAVANRATTIDDLFHASVNGHGMFLSAADPGQLAETFQDILQTITARTGSAASVTINGDELYETVGSTLRMYQSEYTTDNWYGDLTSYAIEIVDGEVVTTPIWSASATMEKLVGNSGGHSFRNIYSWDGHKGVAFIWQELSQRQQLHLLPHFSPERKGEQLVEYLRGADRYELTGDFRTRTKKLGDLVHSQPRFVDYGEGQGVIYVGSNDGMLHAFNAGDTREGEELFAFVPSFVYPNLRELANPEYHHKFYVDGTPFTQRIHEDLVLLVGGLGKGGKGIYALDISDPHGFDQNDVLWEYPPPSQVALSGDTFSFISSGTSDYDEIRDADQRLSIFSAGEYITVAGSGCNGSKSGTNDGTYQVVEAGADSIRVPAGSLLNNCGDNSRLTIFKSTSDPSMGYSFSRPILVRSNDPSINAGTDLAGWVVIFGNGYMSEMGTAVLYILDPLNGNVLKKIDTGTGPLNGLSTPRVTDVDNDLRADYVYAGDLLGNMWKFDLTAGRGDQADMKNPDRCRTGEPCHGQWQVAFCDENDTRGDCNAAGATPKPLFTAAADQAITASPDIMHHSYQSGHMVIFGTGRYLGVNDLEIKPDMPYQSVYGIWDWAPDTYDQGYLGSRVNGYTATGQITTLSHSPMGEGGEGPVNSLLQQVMLREGELTEDSDGDGRLDVTVDDSNGNGIQDSAEGTGVDRNFDLVNEDANGNGLLDTYGYYRIPSKHDGSWRMGQASIDVDGNGRVDAHDRVPMEHLGWYFDLPGRIMQKDGLDNDNDGVTDESGERSLGERVIEDTIIRDGLAITISFGLTGETCSAGAYSFINERDADNGGMPGQPVMDLGGSAPGEQGDNEVDAADTVFLVDDEGTAEVIRGHAADKGVMGHLHKPIILREEESADPDPEEYKIMATGDGDREVLVERAERLGVYYWQQIE